MASTKISAQQSTQLLSISKSQPINEEAIDINILLLGETGVGKTTFINAFVNHLTYNTLDETLKGNMIVIIPAAFSITDPETYESRVIQIGTPDTNENNVENGQSKTQGCKSYVFSLGNRKLRLIDAPGVGDTRGVEQDAKNFEHILAYISQYKHLDGICILLKPNEQRMNVLFRFCVKELLSHLHVSARNNIMFVFTFGRSSFYVPGNTAPLLKTLLKELRHKTGVSVPFTNDNTFTFDNESFRFLAVQKNGVEFTRKHIEEFSNSWDASVKEYGNLVERIVRCKPHVVRDTLSLNEAQQLIRKLHRPMAEVIRLVQENIQLAEKYKIERRKDASKTTTTTTASKNLSNDHISVPQYSAEMILLPYPRTVCTSESCTRVIDVNGVKTVDYSSHCHEHCYLKGVELEVINNPALKQCAAMDQIQKICSKCKCSWAAHKHTTYEYRTYLTSTDIPLNVSGTTNNIQISPSFSSSATSSPATTAELVSPTEAAINKLINDLNEELTIMILVCVKLSRFLRANSITPYNDDTAEYIKHFITEEQLKQKKGTQNSQVIRGLETSLKAYEESMALFKMTAKVDDDIGTILGNDASTTESDDNSKVPKIEEIFPLVESLYDLPINGNKIRQQVEGLKKSQIKNIEHFEQAIQLPSSITASMVVDRLKKALK